MFIVLRLKQSIACQAFFIGKWHWAGLCRYIFQWDIFHDKKNSEWYKEIVFFCTLLWICLESSYSLHKPIQRFWGVNYFLLRYLLPELWIFTSFGFYWKLNICLKEYTIFDQKISVGHTTPSLFLNYYIPWVLHGGYSHSYLTKYG